MTHYDKFLPPEDLPAFHSPFWQSVAARRAAIQQCRACGTFRFIPREICPQCHAAEADWTPIAGTGMLYTYTVVHRAPTPAYQADAPYIIAHVTLAEGPRMIANLTGIAAEDVRIGMAVKLDYFDAGDDAVLYRFIPADPV